MRSKQLLTISILSLAICWSLRLAGQSIANEKDSLQNLFSAGSILSIKDNIACYRLNGIEHKKCYGYCIYDDLYTPHFTSTSTSFDNIKGELTTHIVNSNCYTIIAPVFDYAQPFSEGWGAVCKDKKWTYVSARGHYLCDFAFDAAYPFRNGTAKVVYNGNTYVIDTLGNGIPSSIPRDTHPIDLQIKRQTVRQLFDEMQYEKTIEKGLSLYQDIVQSNGYLIDVSASDLLIAAQSFQYAISAQNHLANLPWERYPAEQEYYQNIMLERRLSTESNHYGLNQYNSKYFTDWLKNNYCNDSLLGIVFYHIDNQNYKAALVKYESWLEGKKDPPTLELIVYYYLAELSDAFETANELLMAIADRFESNESICNSKYHTGVLLSDVKKFQSAEQYLIEALETAKRNNNVLSEIMCRYNLSLVYNEAGSWEKSQNNFERIVIIIRENDSLIPATIKNEILCEYADFLLSHEPLKAENETLIDEYVLSEIEYNTDLFISNDIMHVNKAYGLSLKRMRKFLSHVNSYHNQRYLSNALKLSILQQNINEDYRRAFLISINNSDNYTIQKLWDEYQEMVLDYKGFDIFAINEIDSKNYELASEVNSLERRIKLQLHDAITNNWRTDYSNPLANLAFNQVVIDVIEYQYRNSRYYGVLICRGHMSNIAFIPLCKEDRFSPELFWNQITKNYELHQNDQILLYAGKLESTGLEYQTIGDEIAYFKYNIHRLSSLSNLNNDDNSNYNRKIVLFGGLNYGEEFLALSRGSIKTGYLKYSGIEVDTIENLMESQMNILKYKNTLGTIDKFLAFNSDSPEIIHLATHGYQNNLKHKAYNSIESYMYFDRFNYYRQNTDVENLEWLMNNTGLYLSLDENDSVNILTSREVAACDLSNTRLVVLSACNTISGAHSDSSSGPIGLTKAFIIAQAKNIITSLQNVNDKKSYEFMVLFYNQLHDSNNIYSSFKEAVKRMYILYPSHKEYWGSYVLLENH